MEHYQWAVIEANLDPAIGSEQKSTSPVLIISNEEYNESMHYVTVLPLTSTRRDLYPSEVFLPSGKAGQPLNSIIMAHQIRTLSRQRLGKLYGYLDDMQYRQDVHAAIKEHLDLE